MCIAVFIFNVYYDVYCNKHYILDNCLQIQKEGEKNMVVFVKISKSGHVLEIENVSDVYRYLPYNEELAK